MNTQKVVDKNISDYFNQTYNITKLIIENEQKNLQEIVSSVTNEFKSISHLENQDEVIYKLETLSYVDTVDLLFFKMDGIFYDYSTSLFDSKLIIEKIKQMDSSINNRIIRVKIENKDIILMISKDSIIDELTGRVKAKVYGAKVLNDNFSFLENIKTRAKLLDIYVYFDKGLIASTNNQKNIDLSKFTKKDIFVKQDKIYSSIPYEIYDTDKLEIIYEKKNSTFEVLKDNFIQQAFLLVFFVIFCFILLYYLSNKFIIKPFSQLVDYANKVKDQKDIEYKNTNVLEFDSFAYELNDIISELRDVKEQYSRAIDGVQDGLWDVDLKNKKVFYSPRFKTMLDYDLDDDIAYNSFWQRSIHKKDYKKTLSELKEHINQKSDLFETEYRFKCKNNTYKWIKIRGKLFYDSDDKASRFIGFHTDINDLVLLEKQNQEKERMLYQQSKLASMGEMIGNIAHQWRQPLTIMSVISSSMSMQIQLDKLNKEKAQVNLEKLLNNINYLSSIIDKFRNFFNPNNEVEEFYIDELIKENLVIFESSYKSSNIQLVLDLKSIKVLGFKFELMQVVINIINNAKDALISKMSLRDTNKFIIIKSSVVDDNLVLIVTDNAGGIPSEISEKIYEPYFTTKHQSQGTGLGLYMSNEIIKKHFNGSLSNKTVEYEYEGNKYKGEEFKIQIPLLCD
ncbi:PAS domain-containing protein [Arcobacter roscoffensis]|uniref:histidine kinase n=1 Tax=Arcobacter roscoffensis TaxID=2961520 RepID=A0ABY5E5Z6_9BACT|nr:PAS domain-containing protein [Arcobacter roscoffensis]UTJ06143.1 PAS domain-containing protein [Arcobacter roscoffensis]